MTTKLKRKRLMSTTDREQAIASIIDGTVMLARTSWDGSPRYLVVYEGYTLFDLLDWGVATVEEKIEVIPTLDAEQLKDFGLDWAYQDGEFVDGAITFMYDFRLLGMDTRHVRMGTRNVYKLARECIGVDALHTGSEEDLKEYKAVLRVLIASGKIEHFHDPEAVHMTPNMAHYVMVNADRVDDIVGFIEDRRLTVRDIGIETLDDYLRNYHHAVNQGVL